MYDIVNRALNLMGWQKFSHFGDAAFLSRKAYLQKRDSVTKLSWWASVFEGAVSPEREVIRTIGPYTGRLVQRIFSRVRSEALPQDPDLTLDIVAPAYCLGAPAHHGEDMEVE
jgi:hypothetical protein